MTMLIYAIVNARRLKMHNTKVKAITVNINIITSWNNTSCKTNETNI